MAWLGVAAALVSWRVAEAAADWMHAAGLLLD